MPDLHTVLRKQLKLSDAAFAAEAGLHRTQVWSYRRGKKKPDGDTIAKLLAALQRHGVAMTVDDLLRRPRAASQPRRPAA